VLQRPVVQLAVVFQARSEPAKLLTGRAEQELVGANHGYGLRSGGLLVDGLGTGGLSPSPVTLGRPETIRDEPGNQVGPLSWARTASAVSG
jgi:hypothetical protein